MGAIAEAVKEAVDHDLSMIDKLISRVDKPSDFAGLHQTLKQIAEYAKNKPDYLGEAGDLARMQQFFPSRREESAQRALKAIGTIGAVGLGTGALMSAIPHLSASRHQSQVLKEIADLPIVPRREMAVPVALPKAASLKKSATSPATAAAGAGAAIYGPKLLGAAGVDPESVVGGAARSIGDWIKDLFKSTDNPITHPLFLPAATTAGIATLWGGSRLSSALFKHLRKRRMEREIEGAKEDFQSALRAQYEAAQQAGKAGVKYSCDIHTALDAMSQAFASGELDEQLQSLEKEAGTSLYEPEGAHVGAGNIGIGAYLTLAALLGLGGIAGGYALGKKFDPERGKREALRSALRRRQLAGPPQFVAGIGEDEE